MFIMKMMARNVLRGSKTFLLFLSCSLLFIMYLYNLNYYIIDKPVTVDGHLVSNSKCNVLATDPYDPSIVKFVNKEKYEKCSNSSLLTSIIQNRNGQNVLTLNRNESEHLKNIDCCWSPILRPVPKKPKPEYNVDSAIIVGKCVNFISSVVLPKDIDTLLVTCTDPKKKINSEKWNTEIYQNVHSVINIERVLDRFKVSNKEEVENRRRKLSVLLLGIDNVSRLNFYRALPKTVEYLDKKGWLVMKGYNKMGENAFPNLMAILTGMGEKEALKKCNPSVSFGLDNCPMMWYNFRNAGYVTAYAEDETDWSTFNWLKIGFVDPPTDYYLRPYILACERLLKLRRRFDNIYCTGPELAAERILNSAVDFATKFLGRPYFGFFWTNSITRNSLNSLSLMDSEILSKFEQLEREGVMKDTMIIFLSDHGMRFNEYRKTFMDWYEERLPFFYIWLPEWFRAENPEAYQALQINQIQLTSPFDVYETLRDILLRFDGIAGPSTGCQKCQSLFRTVPEERGCDDAGVPSHWCACEPLEEDNTSSSQIVFQGVQRVLNHIENIVKNYRTKEGKRLCATFKLKKIHKIKKVSDFKFSDSFHSKYFFTIEVTPGDAKFNATVHYYGSGNYTTSNQEISRIDFYGPGSKCLDHGEKSFCQCIE